MLESPELAAVSLRLMTRYVSLALLVAPALTARLSLWKTHDRFWPRLHAMLEAQHKKLLGTADSDVRHAIELMFLADCLDSCDLPLHLHWWRSVSMALSMLLMS